MHFHLEVSGYVYASQYPERPTLSQERPTFHLEILPNGDRIYLHVGEGDVSKYPYKEEKGGCVEYYFYGHPYHQDKQNHLATDTLFLLYQRIGGTFRIEHGWFLPSLEPIAVPTLFFWHVLGVYGQRKIIGMTENGLVGIHFDGNPVALYSAEYMGDCKFTSSSQFTVAKVYLDQETKQLYALMDALASFDLVIWEQGRTMRRRRVSEDAFEASFPHGYFMVPVSAQHILFVRPRRRIYVWDLSGHQDLPCIHRLKVPNDNIVNVSKRYDGVVVGVTDKASLCFWDFRKSVKPFSVVAMNTRTLAKSERIGNGPHLVTCLPDGRIAVSFRAHLEIWNEDKKDDWVSGPPLAPIFCFFTREDNVHFWNQLAVLFGGFHENISATLGRDLCRMVLCYLGRSV